MWYLIIPPIIVILSFSFILWFVGRKSHRLISAEMVRGTREEMPHQPSFGRTKAFSLGFLEKVTQKSKIASLKIHNALNELVQKIRARRQAMQEKMKASPPLFSSEGTSATDVWHRLKLKRRMHEGSEFEKLSETNVLPEPSAGGKETEPSEPIVSEKKSFLGGEDILARPLTRYPRSRQIPHPSGVPSETEKSSAETSDMPRPMVSDKVHPEMTRKRKVTYSDMAREEELIARIATNPKDFVTYEALGDYYMEVGNIKDAKECYRQVLKLSPVHRMVKIKIRRLEKLLAQKAGEV